METLKKKSLFWDVANLDPEKNAMFIIERILGLGEKEDAEWAIGYYGKDAIKKALLKTKSLDNKSLFFWFDFFNLNPEQCLKQQSILKQSAFWKR